MIIAPVKQATPQSEPKAEIKLLDGSAWEIYILNGERVGSVKAPETVFMRFKDNRLSARFNCAVFSGTYEQQENRLKVSNLDEESRQNCKDDEQAADAILRKMLRSELRFQRYSSNFLIASADHKIFSQKEK